MKRSRAAILLCALTGCGAAGAHDTQGGAESVKHFLGNSENVVKTQVWCAVATYVLIAIVKKELQLDASLYTNLQILSVSVFEKTQLSSALQANAEDISELDLANQLNLFDI